MVVINDGAKIVYLNCRYILWPSTWSVGMHARSRSYPSIGLLPIAFSRSPLGKYCNFCKYCFLFLGMSKLIAISMRMAPGWRTHCRPAPRSFLFSTSLWSGGNIFIRLLWQEYGVQVWETKWCVRKSIMLLEASSLSRDYENLVRQVRFITRKSIK